MSPGEVQARVVAERSALIERMLAAVETLPLGSREDFLEDPRMVAAGESFLRRSLEGLFDIGRHVLAKAFGDPASEYKEIADRLREHGVLAAEEAERLRRMAGYRNRLVHFYDEVTADELYGILSERIGDVRELLDAIRRWLAENEDRVSNEL